MEPHEQAATGNVPPGLNAHFWRAFCADVSGGSGCFQAETVLTPKRHFAMAQTRFLATDGASNSGPIP
jgi:hypothetical protein